MSFFDSLPGIPEFRPMLNIGSMLDIPVGEYILGSKGQMILNGGLCPIMGIAGPPNSFKSALATHIELSITNRYKPYCFAVYDTEGSTKYARMIQLSQHMDNIKHIKHGDPSLPPEDRRTMISSSSDILGDVYFEKILDIAKEKKKDTKNYLTTPMLSNGEQIKIKTPHGFLFDSLSHFKVTANETNIIDKNNIGDSGNNIYYMKQGIAKKQLIDQLPHITANSGIWVAMTVHVGDEFEMGGPMQPKKHKLLYSKKGSKVTGATKAYEFIPTVGYEITNISKLNNKEYRTGVLYPSTDRDREEDCVDLLSIELTLTRNKNGQTGPVIDFVLSQAEGILPHLSMFHTVKEADDYGIGGNKQNYFMHLCPDVKLSRTTVRNQIDNNYKLRRALEITSELYQMHTLWAPLPNDLYCTTDVLYNDLKALGYDWDVLLNTRGYWVFEEHEHLETYKELSTYDLLRMRKGLYHPYWMPPL